MEVEKETVAEGTASISSEQRLLPTAIELIETVSIGEKFYSVLFCNGITYIGGNNGVKKVNRNYKLAENFLFRLKDSGFVWTISVHNDRIYTLSSDSTVRVHDLEGKFITSWTYTDDKLKLVNHLAIINNLIAIPNRLNKTLIFYSLNGEVVNTLPCPLLTDTPVCLSAADNNSIIISQYESSLVYKVDTSSGDIIWQCKDVTEPLGVTCYRDEFVLLAHNTKPATLCVLSLHTG